MPEPRYRLADVGVSDEDLMATESIPLSGSQLASGQDRSLHAMMAALIVAGGPATAGLEVTSALLHSVGVHAASYPADYDLLSLSDVGGSPLTVSVRGRGVVGTLAAFPHTVYAWLVPGDALQLTTARGASIVGLRDAHALQLGVVYEDRPSDAPPGTVLDAATLRRLASRCSAEPLRAALEQAAASSDTWDALSALADVLGCGILDVVDEGARLLRNLEPSARDAALWALHDVEALVEADEAHRARAARLEAREWPALATLAQRERERIVRLREVLQPDSSEEGS